MITRTNKGVIIPGNKNMRGRAMPMSPRAGVTKTRRRYDNGGKTK